MTRGSHVERIGYLHVTACGSRDCLDRYGRPSRVDDLSGHRLVWQGRGDVGERESLNAFFDFSIFGANTVVSAESSVAHFMAIADGCGLGILPTYAAAVLPGALEFLDLGGHFRRESVLVMNKDAVAREKNGKVVGWIRDAFRSDLYPWFDERFIWPGDFSDVALKRVTRVISRERP